MTDDDHRDGMRPAQTRHVQRVDSGVSTTGSHIRARVGQALIAAGRHLSRLGARAMRHPSAGPASLDRPSRMELAAQQREWRRASASRRARTEQGSA